MVFSYLVISRVVSRDGSRPVGSGIGLLETVCRFEAFYLHPPNMPNPLLLKSQVGLMFLFLLFVDLDMSLWRVRVGLKPPTSQGVPPILSSAIFEVLTLAGWTSPFRKTRLKAIP